MFSATYSPDDNKLRLYSTARLDAETYARVKAAGFRWAPKQELFVAPMWTPERADLLVELCGDIDDEDTSLVDRAEERAERFEEYGDKRAEDAERAHEAVAAVAERFAGGQPILVGHHSEKRARKDAERIQSGMRKAVKLWETSRYWAERAKGALRHAKYKELPGVRHRRIKGLEADRRAHVRDRDDAMSSLRLWAIPELTREKAMAIANYDHSGTWGDLDKGAITVDDARVRAKAQHERRCEHAERWIAHIDNRLAYERAMLDDAGGIAADKFAIEVGGRVLERDTWHVVVRVNRKDGAITSVTVPNRWGFGAGAAPIPIDKIADYRPPVEGDAAKVKAASKTGPLVNYPGEGFRHMTKADWEKISRWSEFSRAHKIAPSEKHGAYRLRMAPKEGRPYYDTTGVYITDQKRVDPPPPAGAEPVRLEREREPRAPRAPRVAAEPSKFDALKDALKAGVQVVSAPQLFPTPAPLAARMVELAGVEPGHVVLEPSAGTGVLVREVQRAGADVVAVEVSGQLAKMLDALPCPVRCADFLTITASDVDGPFDRIVINPPFAGGADVAHVLHARTMLKPGGRLVALCANGPRQRDALKSLASTWEDLPEGSFKEAGTNVRVALITIDAPAVVQVAS